MMASVQDASAGHAHSFAHFHGPVEGPAEEITFHGKHGYHHGYVAHPKYDFSYGVEDHHTGDHHGQKEHRDGKFELSYLLLVGKLNRRYLFLNERRG